MKNTILLIEALAFGANLLLGVLLSSYESFNLYFTSAVIIINTILLYIVFAKNYKDGYKIGIGSFFIFLELVEYILGLLSGSNIQDNGFVIACIILVLIQIAILIIVQRLSIKE